MREDFSGEEIVIDPTKIQPPLGFFETDRPLSDYEEFLEISGVNFYVWENVMDLESGMVDLGERTQFTQDVASLYPHVRVHSVNPRARRPRPGDLVVAAEGKAQPFPDNYFDAVLALYSLPLYSKGRDVMMEEISEMIRITKPAGEVRMFPIREKQALYLKFKLDQRTDIVCEWRSREIEGLVTGRRGFVYLLIIRKL